MRENDHTENDPEYPVFLRKSISQNFLLNLLRTGRINISEKNVRTEGRKLKWQDGVLY